MEGASSPFYSELGIPDHCQVTVGRSLDKMLTETVTMIAPRLAMPPSIHNHIICYYISHFYHYIHASACLVLDTFTSPSPSHILFTFSSSYLATYPTYPVEGCSRPLAPGPWPLTHGS